ncbi:unnamed protein product [Trichogramma brassicae]|uniref:Uncharacterized protein n=1 Tax=Trichogramma brassicae TaxID=86971 RepID=A0A6H5J230_9HYME|nr:unnamed protein product [Trichogramma brassicae]
MRRMGDVWKTTTNRSSRNAQLTPASPKQCLTADTVPRTPSLLTWRFAFVNKLERVLCKSAQVKVAQCEPTARQQPKYRIMYPLAALDGASKRRKNQPSESSAEVASIYPALRSGIFQHWHVDLELFKVHCAAIIFDISNMKI